MASAIRELKDRHIPQVLAVYLGAAFGVVQFVDFVGSRYLLPAIWTDLTLLALALLLPSVLLYTYNHGKPGKDEWRSSEKIFIPINLAVLLGLVGFVGAGSSLAPTSKRITVTDEKGNSREAVVANKAYRKRVAVFMFDTPADTALQWLQFGLPQMAVEDLQQSNFIEAMPSVYMRPGLQKVGFPRGVNVPLSAKRNVVSELHVPHFVTGRLAKQGAEYMATVQIYETESAKLVRERTYRGGDPTQLADQISAGLLKDLEIPVLSDSKPDMPVSEILSANGQAVRRYLEAMSAIYVESDFPRAMSRISEAVQLDDSFASAHFLHFVLARLSNQPQPALAAVKSALDHSYRLPERTREMVKANFYIAREDWPHAYAVCEMLAQMYPDDIAIQQMLVEINSLRNDKQALIASLKKVLELDPSRSEFLLQLGQVHEARGETKQALEQYQRYAIKHPTDARGLASIGRLHRRQGALTEAKAAYNKALLVKPDDPETLRDLARVHLVQGDFGTAEQNLADAMAAARTPEDRMAAMNAAMNMQIFRGDMRGAIKSAEAYLAELAKVAPALAVHSAAAELQIPWQWARVDTNTARRKLAELRAQLAAPPGSYAIPRAEVPYFVEIGDAAGAEAALRRLDAIIQQNSWHFMAAASRTGHARLAELRGDCEQAVEFFREAARLDPTDSDVATDIGRCLRKLNRLEEAEAELMKTLRLMPAHGETNLELGLLHQHRGDANRARTHLQRAVQTWQTADPAYQPARAARAALASLP